MGALQVEHRLLHTLGPLAPVRYEHHVALVTHDAAHRQPAATGQVGEAARVVGRAAAARHADVDVDDHLAQAAVDRGVDGRLGVDGHRDARVVGDEQAPEAVGVEHLVGEQEVFDQPGRDQSFDLVDRRGREARVVQLALALGEHRALVGLDVRTQPGARQRVGHGRQVVLERGDVDQQRRGPQLVDPHAVDPNAGRERGSGRSRSLSGSKGLGKCYCRVTRSCR